MTAQLWLTCSQNPKTQNKKWKKWSQEKPSASSTPWQPTQCHFQGPGITRNTISGDQGGEVAVPADPEALLLPTQPLRRIMERPEDSLRSPGAGAQGGHHPGALLRNSMSTLTLHLYFQVLSLRRWRADWGEGVVVRFCKIKKSLEGKPGWPPTPATPPYRVRGSTGRAPPQGLTEPAPAARSEVGEGASP